MAVKKVIAILCILLPVVILLACSKKPDCLVADSLKEVKTVLLNNEKYSLYLRISGFSEKEIFYELYKDKPEFDQCGNPAAAPVSKIHVDTTEGTPVKLKIIDFLLKIEYKPVDNDKFDPANMVVEIYR